MWLAEMNHVNDILVSFIEPPDENTVYEWPGENDLWNVGRETDIDIS